MITLAMIAALAMPPKQYDHPPRHHVEVTDFPAEFIEAVCRKRGFVLGCYNAEVNMIYLRDDLSPKARAKVLRHEYGHVNGWSHL